MVDRYAVGGPEIDRLFPLPNTGPSNAQAVRWNVVLGAEGIGGKKLPGNNWNQELINNEITMVSIHADVTNRIYINQPIETNLYNLIYQPYVQAFNMALERFNMKKTTTANSGNKTFPLTAHGYRQLSSRVTLTIQNMPLSNAEGERVDYVMRSDNVAIVVSGQPHGVFGGDRTTVRRICSVFYNRFLSNRDVSEEASNFNWIISPEYLNNIQFQFDFKFLKAPNWQGMSRAQYEAFEWVRPPQEHEYYDEYFDFGPLPPPLEEEQDDFEGADWDEIEDFLNPLPQIPEPIPAPEYEPPPQRPRNLVPLELPPPMQTRLRTAQAAQARLALGLNAQGYSRPVRTRNPIDYLGARTMGGGEPLQKDRSQLFFKRTYMDLFKRSNSCIATPYTYEQMCFPMAFLRCEKRSWIRGMEFVEGEWTNTDNFTDVRPNEKEIIELEEIPDMFSKCQYHFFDAKKKTINVFSNQKKFIRDEKGKVYVNEAEDITELEKKCWLWCAYQLHNYVETVLDTKIDVNNQEEALDAYSFTFQVNISIFVAEIGSERVDFIPIDRRPGVLIREEGCIALLLKGQHMNAISNIRNYHKKCAQKIICHHAYCDFCTKVNIKWTKNDNCVHQFDCWKNKKWSNEDSLVKLQKTEQSKYGRSILYKELKVEEKHKLACFTCGEVEFNCHCSEGKSQIKSGICVDCQCCFQSVLRCRWNRHICYMRPKKHKPALKESSIYAYDIEACQTYCPEAKQYVHKDILVVMAGVYDKTKKWRFPNIAEFVDFLIQNEEMWGSTIIAHNGGGYDHLFVQRYLEKNDISHNTIPRPNTIHKHLMMTISMPNSESDIKFLDFMMFMTDSLKNIGSAFNLPVSKGDFPHNFSKEEHLNYCGPMPELDNENDWYGFKTVKSQKELDEARHYWEEQQLVYCTCKSNELCNCTKKKWDFQTVLYDYCVLDVEVLAGAIKAYRDQALAFIGESDFNWSAKGLEPFQYMTQSQIALALFLEGQHKNNLMISKEKIRKSFNPKSICWLEREMEEHPEYNIIHAGNSSSEYYDTTSIRGYCTGFCENTNTIFHYFDCYLDGCMVCYADKIKDPNEMHPTKKIPWKIIREDTEELIQKMLCMGGDRATNFKYRWAHEDKEEEYSEYLTEASHLMNSRDAFYGGRTEVFAAYADATRFKDCEILHHDVCSLYPYVCSMKPLPIGHQTVYFGKKIDIARLHPSHPDPYFGFARIKVRPNKKDFIAILPSRETVEHDKNTRLVYDLQEKIGCWHTELIYLALEHDYEILEVYEVWHWPESQRSTTLMKGYMEFFLRVKQQAEGWKKLKMGIYDDIDENDLTEEQKENICDYIKKQNGGFARPDAPLVAKNPVKRQLAKIFLNCLWGKLCQKPPKEHEQFVYGYKHYFELCSSSMVDESTLKFREITPQVFKARFTSIGGENPVNKCLNVHVAASVTAHAQVVLMRRMFEIGPENVLYCDTDSIMFLNFKNNNQEASTGLGSWTDEHPGAYIDKFMALAPKSYLMQIHEKKEIEYYFKCKGVRSTEENRRLTSMGNIQKIIESAFMPEKEEFTVSANTMTIHPNSTCAYLPYGALCTRYGEKTIQTVYSKRNLILNENPNVTKIEDMALIRLVPFGYEGELGHLM